MIGRGRLIADTEVASSSRSLLGHPRPGSLTAADAAGERSAAGGGRLETARGWRAVGHRPHHRAIGDIAARQHLVLHELSLVQASLEEAFMELTEDAVDFQHAEGTATDITMPVGATAGTEAEQ